jgi:hypothetical protein
MQPRLAFSRPARVDRTPAPRARAVRPSLRSSALLLPALAALSLGALSCDGDDAGRHAEQREIEQQAAAAAAAIDPTPIDGMYDVKGVTVGGGEERDISGTVILRVEEGADRYSATFKLATTFPGLEDPVHADVIGTGEGQIQGRTLTGTTNTQLVISTVPGVDTGFAFVPRMVGARIVSSGTTEIQPNGQVVIEMANKPAEGEEYIPTRTRLTGLRIDEPATPTPDVAAGAPN